MTDTTGNTTPDTTRHDADTAPPGLTPTAAAARLGLTPDAVRARLRRGTLRGARVGGDWRVFLPPDAAAPAETRHDADTTRHDDRHDADTTSGGEAPTVGPAVLAAKDETIALLRDENAFLRAQLDHSRRELAAERERFDVIHRTALGRLEALTAGGTSQDAPVAAREAPHAAEAPDRAGDPSPSPRRPWWRRLLWGDA
jgi:hypothetical protein